jgi:nucleoside 2-deoxyribosyltransferase
MSITPSRRSAPNSVYVSSPLGFSVFGRQALQLLHEELRAAGFHVRDPWDWPGQRDPVAPIRTADLLLTARLAGERRDWQVSQEIAARNITELRAARAMLAILDGADVDSGVAAEVGFASAIGTPVVGLRTDDRATSDSSGYLVNLQVTHLIAHSGPPEGRVTRDVPEAIEALRAMMED